MTFPFPTYVFGRLFLKKEKSEFRKEVLKNTLVTDSENIENILPHISTSW